MLILKNCRFIPFLTEGVPFTQGHVLLDGGKISKIVPVDSELDADAQVLDLEGMTLMPGLIDMHVHLFIRSFGQLLNGADKTVTTPEWTINAVCYAEALLDAGYTTVRDVGDNPALPAMYVAKAIRRGELRGPNVLTSGPIIESSFTTVTALNCMVDGPMGFRWACRNNMRNGADFIKLYGSGSLMLPSNEPGFPIIEPDELAEAVQIAKRYSTYVAIHAHGPTAIDMAVRGGVHTIEHASMISEETLRYIEEHCPDTGLVPTLFALDSLLKEADTPNGVRARSLKDRIVASLRSAYHDHHVAIGWGTDVSLEDYLKDPTREFQLRSQLLDYSNEDILKQVTINSAKLMYLDDRIGSIKEGKDADLVVVSGDPVSDISVMYHKPEHVIKGGKIIR